MVGVENYCAFLDRVTGIRFVRAYDIETQVAPEKEQYHEGHQGPGSKASDLFFVSFVVS